MALIDLFSSAVRLYGDGTVRAEERRMSGDLDGWTLAAFHVETDEDVHADHWEMHPAADEAVCVLAGGARLILRADEATGAAEETAVLGPGTAYIVPRGRWHRVELDGPGDLMSLTLRRDTRLEKRRDG
ncbi:cupin domain-containing protein [Streptomyces sp. XD-27]|uniref:cupin domain-containing protein n=1 Tax=Streptomyces sp. XD-27 TaxID=3062779 RepID=UPI0026F41BE3|nr:cupin domain-containing protein [Streptomyces sp. XD-27]WKX71155.1 cupin domain-containing protein [Streptomyces sp. XD-27]